MKKIFSAIILAAIGTSMLTGCIEEVEPLGGEATLDQVAEAPNAFDNMVSGLTTGLSGKRDYSPGNNQNVWDYGYTSFFLTRDVEGQDVIATGSNNHLRFRNSHGQYIISGLPTVIML